MVAEAAPGSKHRLMDGVRVQLQLAGQSGWCSSPYQTEKHRALIGSEVRIHRLPDHSGEVPRLGLEVGARVCRGKFLPELWRERRARAVPPHVLAQLCHHLEDDEPGGPGREPALATKVSDLANDDEQGVGCGLAGQVVEIRSGDAQVDGSLARLTPGSSQEDPMEFLAGSLVRRAGAGQAPDPLLVIDRTGGVVSCPGLGAVQVSECAAHDDAHRFHRVERSVDSIGWVLPYRLERFWAASGSTVHHKPRT